MSKAMLYLIAVGVFCSAGCRVTVRDEPPPRREVVYVHEAHPDHRPATTEVVVVQEAPPPPKREVIVGVAPSPNHVWIGGYWRWDGHAHVWVGGAWHPRPRTNAVWVEGRWERRGNGHVWIAGHWR
jgi:hypothetical protein